MLDRDEAFNPYEPPRLAVGRARVEGPQGGGASSASLRPGWVRLGLWGMFGFGQTRRSARQMMWFTCGSGVPGLVLGVWPGLVLFASAVWIELAIRWMDRHDAW